MPIGVYSGGGAKSLAVVITEDRVYACGTVGVLRIRMVFRISYGVDRLIAS
jgi:hypothetical protein